MNAENSYCIKRFEHMLQIAMQLVQFFVRFYRNLTVGHLDLPKRAVQVFHTYQHLKFGRNLGRFVPGAPKSVVELAGDSVF